MSDFEDMVGSVHPEHADIELAAQMHAAYYHSLVRRGIPQDHACEFAVAFIELAYDKDDDD